MPNWSARFLKRMDHDRVSITDRLVDAIRAELPEYAALPRGPIVEATAIDLDQFIGLLEERRPPSEADAKRSLDVARARARSGFPVAVFLESFNVARRESLALVEEIGCELRLSVEERRLIEQAVSDWSGMLMVHASRAFLELGSGDKGTEHHRRALLRRLLHGELDAEVQGRAALFGLHPEGQYRAFAALPAPGEDSWDLAHAVTRTGSRGTVSALVAEMEGRVVGVVVQRPALPNPSTILGLGPEGSLGELEHSYAEACRVLNAGRFGAKAGVCTLSDVALESAMLEDPERSRALVARYAGSLDEEDDASSRRILDTVRIWLERNANVQEVADVLAVHPNTVRYRLQAYVDRTDERLETARDRWAAWWALTWARRSPDDLNQSAAKQ